MLSSKRIFNFEKLWLFYSLFYAVNFNIFNELGEPLYNKYYSYL